MPEIYDQTGTLNFVNFKNYCKIDCFSFFFFFLKEKKIQLECSYFNRKNRSIHVRQFGIPIDLVWNFKKYISLHFEYQLN